MYRFNANSCATISSTAIFLSQQSRQYFSSPRGSDTSLAPHSAHRAAPAAGGADPPPGRSALDHLGLIVRTPDEVDRWAAFLESEGVAIGARPRTHRDGARSCYFRDPDGNSIQIIHHPPISDKV